MVQNHRIDIGKKTVRHQCDYTTLRIRGTGAKKNSSSRQWALPAAARSPISDLAERGQENDLGRTN